MPADESARTRAILTGRWLLKALAEVGLLAALTVLKTRALLAGTPMGTSAGYLATFMVVICAVSATFFVSIRARRILLLIAMIVVSVVLFADQVHYRAYREWISVRELGHAGQLASVFTGIAPYVHGSDLWLVADWPVWFWLARRRPNPGPSAPARSRRIAGVFAIALSLTLCTAIVWEYALAPRPGRIFVTNQRLAVREVGILGFHLFDCVDLARNRPTPRQVRVEDLQFVQRWLAGRSSPVGAANALPFGAAQGANLIFLQLESFEAFLLGLVVNGHEITPRLNRLQQTSWHCQRFFPQSGIGTTSDAEYCALNSLLPATDEVVARRDAANTFRALPALLARQGYQTMAMSVCRPDLWNMGWMHRQYGFERRYYHETFTPGREDPLTITDDRFFARARELLRASPQPFFAHLMTISTHAPFVYLPARWARLDLGPWQRGVLGDYLQAAHFVDHEVGEFLDGLRTDGVLDRTVVFIYGDHEALPADERWKVRALESDPIGARLDERLRRRVPLLIVVPGQTNGVRLKRIAGQVDLTPTALHLLGVEDRRAPHLGQNLFQATNSFVVFRSGAFATDDYFFNSPDGLLSSGGCEPIQPGAAIDDRACADSWRLGQEHLRISDLIREQNMIPALERATGSFP